MVLDDLLIELMAVAGRDRPKSCGAARTAPTEDHQRCC